MGWPRAENDDYIIVLGSARPLEDCIRLAMFELLGWLVDEYGFEREEAWQLLGQLVRLDIANVVDPHYTVAAKFPKRFLPAWPALRPCSWLQDCPAGSIGIRGSSRIATRQTGFLSGRSV